jgi:hypothetical protein
MDVAPRKQNYVAHTLSSIASTMAGRAGLVASVKADSCKALSCVQNSETDFSFLNRLVGGSGCWLRPKTDGIEVFGSFQSGSTVEWRGEGDLIDFCIEGELAPAIVNGSQPEFYNSVERLTGAVQLASKMLQEDEHSIGGSVTGTGHSRNQTLRAGNTVEIDGDISAKGTYGLIKVEHLWERRGYMNAFTCTPWKNYCDPRPQEEPVEDAILQAR